MANRFRIWLAARAGIYREFPNYIRGLKKTAIQEILYGESVIAIAFAVYTYVYSISLASVLIVLAASFVLAGYHIWRVDHLRLIAGIKLEEIRQQPAQAGPANRTYVQLVMRCATEVAIEECKGWLLRVWKWSATSNDWETIEPNQALRLNWSPGIEAPITLFPKVPEIIDVLFVSDHDPRIFFCSSWVPQRAQTIDIQQPILLKFEVAVNGKDADSRKSLPPLPISFKVSIQRWPVIDSIEQL